MFISAIPEGSSGAEARRRGAIPAQCYEGGIAARGWKAAAFTTHHNNAT